MSERTASPAAAGDLLVATPALLDPNFERTVVLVLDIDDDGALGVVLNRPSRVSVGEILPQWRDLATAPDLLFEGGPVGTDSALAVGVSEPLSPGPGPDPGDGPLGFRRLYGDVGIVDLDTPTEIVGSSLSRLRIFAGYAGWGSEQLLAEIRSGSWYVLPSLPGDLFAGEPETLWTRVLRRQPGELAWVSTRPLDPSMN